MSINEALEIIKKGMSTELWGRRFYQQAAANTRDETGKRVFQTLVEEESRHLDILRGEYAAISGGGKWLSVEDAVAQAASVEPTTIFPQPSAAEILIAAGTTDEEALALAMDFERRGYNLYKAEADKQASAQEKRLWTFLAKAEDMHYAFLDKTLEFLKTNGTWYFDEREFPFFET